MATRMLQRRGTAAEWSAANPVLGDGEIGFERDTKHVKIGDGTTAWASLNSIQQVVQAIAAGDVAQTVKGFSGQTASLTNWVNSTGTPVALMNSAGQMIATGLAAGAVTTLRKTFDIYNSRGIVGGSTTPATQATLSVQSTATTDVALLVQAMAGQSGDLAQWNNSGGTPVVKISAGGVVNTQDFYANGAINARLTTYQGAAMAAQTASATEKGLLIKLFSGQSANPFEIDDSVGGVKASFTALGGLRTNDYSLMMPSAANIVPLAVRGFSGQSVNLQEWQNNAGTPKASINQNGDIYSPNGSLGINIGPYTGSARIATTMGTVGEIGILVRAMAGQTGDLTQWQNSTPTVIASLAASGGFFAQSTLVGSATQPLSPGSHGATSSVVAQGAAYVGQIIKGFTSQTEDLSEWQSSIGSVLAKIDNVGNFSAANTPTTHGTFTPTVSGATVGNGSLTGTWIRAGGLVFASISFVLGSTSSITGGVSFTFPTGTVPIYTGNYSATISGYAAAGPLWGAAGALWNSGGNVYTGISNGTRAWAANDQIIVSGVFPAA